VVGSDDLDIQEFKDQLTAFNAVKKEELEGKGELNCLITSSIFSFLAAQGIATHFIQKLSNTTIVTKKLQMIPLEVVVRNIMAGSTAKKLGIAEGTLISQPLVEFYYKKDELADPFVSDDQALLLQTVSNQQELDELKRIALKINEGLKSFFAKCEIKLVDFKLEFGKNEQGKIVLGDEISPDSCRLWDQKTDEKLDKDRFRRDLGQVKEKYQDVWNRIQNKWSQYV
jgi:phosphoribosylaminoimidazole-succinocarboxamide synthase